MKIVCFGDSLTEGDYGTDKHGVSNVQSENYPFFLSKILNCEVENYGVCGITSSQCLDLYNEKKPDISDADIILVMLGTNGGLSPVDDTECNKDYEILVQKIRNDASKATVFLITPPHCTNDPKKVNYGYKENVDNAVAFVRNYCKRTNTNLIDLATCKDFCAETEDIMQPNDGLHFGKTGYETMAKFIADKLKCFL